MIFENFSYRQAHSEEVRFKASAERVSRSKYHRGTKEANFWEFWMGIEQLSQTHLQAGWFSFSCSIPSASRYSASVGKVPRSSHGFFLSSTPEKCYVNDAVGRFPSEETIPYLSLDMWNAHYFVHSA